MLCSPALFWKAYFLSAWIPILEAAVPLQGMNWTKGMRVGGAFDFVLTATWLSYWIMLTGDEKNVYIQLSLNKTKYFQGNHDALPCTVILCDVLISC